METSAAPLPATAPEPDPAPRPRIVLGAVASVAVGFLITVFWSYEFVDDVVGGAITGLFLGADHAADPGLVGALAFATVAGLAGTFTACNIACFASVGPLAAEAGSAALSRTALVRHAATQLGWLALGMCLVAATYGAVVVALGERSLMLSDATFGGLPARLLQASVINVALGVGLVYVAVRYLRGNPLRGRVGILGLGTLLGLLVVGRPFPMFREVLQAAVESNPFAGVGMLVLVVIGNVAIVAVLYLGFVAAAGPALQRYVGRHQGAVLRVGGYLLLALAAFSVAYWGLRVPAMFGVGWFPAV
ncbi:hypothetical protein UQW22_05235 [Isoptericola halotolerans]|uniref:hypothetical protein n=1 Tax=Isoptericola halotolerans TaxID=300560 RepID=UPI00388F054B